MDFNKPTLDALLLAITFGSFLYTSAIRRSNANSDSAGAGAGKLSLASRVKLTCKRTVGD